LSHWLKVVVPLTDWKEHYAQVPWMVLIESTDETGLSKRSAADCFQVRSVSQERLSRQIGWVTEDTLAEIGRALGRVLGF
jgi:mRNA interferase MazF